MFLFSEGIIEIVMKGIITANVVQYVCLQGIIVIVQYVCV